MAKLNINFGFIPRRWQAECIAKQTRFTVLAVHRRAGKTNLAIFELVQSAFAKRGLYAYIAPELKQARLIAWDCLKQMVDQLRNLPAPNGEPLIEVHETEPYVKLYNGSKIMLFGADKPDRMRGSKLSGAIIDEVAQMPRELWSEIVYPALMDSHGWALFIGTPKGINLFSELFERGQNPKYKPDWSSRKYTCYETDALRPEDIENYKRDVSEDEFRREMLCDFTAAAEDQLLSIAVIEIASKRDHDPRLFDRNSLIMSLDVARYGDDSSIISFRRGLIAEPQIEFKGLDLVTLAERAALIYKKRKPAALYVDGTGVGGGVVDILAKFGINAFDINFGQKSTVKEYFNKRTEIWCRMADWIKKGGQIPNDADLKVELSAPTYQKNDAGQIVLESKKDIKERIGKSPDHADSLALTFVDFIPEETANPTDDIYQELFDNKHKYETPHERFERQIRNRPYLRRASSAVYGFMGRGW